MKGKARLFIVSAPSGCGKGTILSEVFKDTDAYFSVSYTTRTPRPGEVDGLNYHFVTDEEFLRMIDNDEFLEYAAFADKRYGTGRKNVEDNLAAGRDVILEIETQGAFQVKEKCPEAVMIFILPPSVKELDRRLHKRATEDEEVIRKRLSQAKGELEKALRYDYVIMNDALEDAVEDFKAVVAQARGDIPSDDRYSTKNEANIELIREVLENA